MISSIFGKTKPINYIILLGFLFTFYWILLLLVYQRAYTPEELLVQTVVLALLLFGIFVVDFIVKRNQITGTNAYTILFYVALIVLFSDVLTDNNAIMCSFFLLLAHRRLLSLRTLKDFKSKLFDTTLWTGVASLFYDWALLYLVLVFIAIYFYEPRNIRNWLVPFLGVSTVAIILVGTLILLDKVYMVTDHYTFSLNFNTNFFTYWANSTKLFIYALLTLLTGFWAFLKLGKLGTGKLITIRLVAISFVIGSLLTVLESSATSFPILISFFPASILITKYVEVIRKVRIKEILLIASVTLPLVIFIAELIIK